MQLKEVIQYIEEIAPLSFQESYDNSGLIVGNPRLEVSGILISLDVTEAIVQEAIEKKANVIIAHHPIVFKGLKKFTGKNYVERVVIQAIKNDIAIYAAHTNLDSVVGGVNTRICEKLGLRNCEILQTSENQLIKLVSFIPEAHFPKVEQAVFQAGAGHIGNYDQCAYSSKGTGSFRALSEANPFVGNKMNYIERMRSDLKLFFRNI